MRGAGSLLSARRSARTSATREPLRTRGSRASAGPWRSGATTRCSDRYPYAVPCRRPRCRTSGRDRAVDEEQKRAVRSSRGIRLPRCHRFLRPRPQGHRSRRTGHPPGLATDWSTSPSDRAVTIAVPFGVMIFTACMSRAHSTRAGPARSTKSAPSTPRPRSRARVSRPGSMNGSRLRDGSRWTWCACARGGGRNPLVSDRA